MPSVIKSLPFRLVAVVAYLVGACLVTSWALATYRQPASAEAERYLMKGIEQIRTYHINSASLAWEQITAAARRRIRRAAEPSDTYGTMRWVLRQAGERHSFFLTPAQARSMGRSSLLDSSAPKLPAARRIDNIGLVALPTQASAPAERDARARKYLTTLREPLARLDQSRLCGWIVDLRDNGGGNMWPMLGGLDPLLGAPPYGYFVDRHGSVTPWDQRMAAPPTRLRQGNLPVAVLLSRRTASSGEMTVLSLIGRPGVRTFGEKSAGLTTGNMSIPMSDGALLVITASTARDRTGRDYRGAITPDVEVGAARAEDAAIQWLHSRCNARTIGDAKL